MSQWEKFKKTESASDKPPHRQIEGIFLCQTCREMVEEADYFFTDGVLRYKCSQEHASFLENFQLGY